MMGPPSILLESDSLAESAISPMGNFKPGSCVSLAWRYQHRVRLFLGGLPVSGGMHLQHVDERVERAGHESHAILCTRATPTHRHCVDHTHSEDGREEDFTAAR